MSTQLTYATMPKDLKRIANDALGLGVLKSVFVSGVEYNLIFKVSDGVVVGFGLYHFDERTLGEEKYTVGVIDIVCVDTPYRTNGFGSSLTFGILCKMSAHNVDRVELVLKTPRRDVAIDTTPGVPTGGSTEMLESLGFRRVQRFEGHYAKRSAMFGTDCILCNSEPDSCDGILYAISDRD